MLLQLKLRQLPKRQQLKLRQLLKRQKPMLDFVLRRLNWRLRSGSCRCRGVDLQSAVRGDVDLRLALLRIRIVVFPKRKEIRYRIRIFPWVMPIPTTLRDVVVLLVARCARSQLR